MDCSYEKILQRENELEFFACFFPTISFGRKSNALSFAIKKDQKEKYY